MKSYEITNHIKNLKSKWHSSYLWVSKHQTWKLQIALSKSSDTLAAKKKPKEIPRAIFYKRKQPLEISFNL